MIPICIVFSDSSYNQKSNYEHHFHVDSNAGLPKPTATNQKFIVAGGNGGRFSGNVDHEFGHRDETSTNLSTSTPATVEQLIESVAQNGDNYEEKIRLEMNDLMRSSFW